AVIRSGTLLPVADIVHTPGEKARLWIETGAAAVDTESARILEWAHSLGVPATVVRGVSDVATAGIPRGLAAAVGPGGRVSRGQALRAMLSRPAALADAIALGRGTGAALKTVAGAIARLARAGR